MEDIQTAMKATAALVTATDHKSVISDWTKTAVKTLKNTSFNEKTELQRLNIELQKYLNNVKVLEDLNSALMAQVETEKSLSTPKIMDKSKLDENLQSTRDDLEKMAFNAVESEIKLEEAKSLSMELNERSKFVSNEAELARKKIQMLQMQLSEFEAQKEALARGAVIAKESINREQERISKAEIDLEKLLNSLSLERSRSKKVEFEIHTYMDELAFRKEVHKEELEDLKKRVTQSPLSTLDLNNFYKSELITAVKQIRDDFHALNDRQLEDFKKHKEGELVVAYSIAEEDKAYAQQVKARRDTSVERDSQSKKEMEIFLEDSKPEIDILSKRYNDRMNHLATLENRLYEMRLKNGDQLDRQQFEIDKIKHQNEEMINELEYWGRVTRAKLENEIQTYRSILNCQVKLMHDSASEASLTLQSLKTSTATSSSNVDTQKINTKEKISKSDEKEAIDILKQVFNYMDSDKSQTINSKELDRVLERLNIKLDKEGYNQLCREFDTDASRAIDFKEFCQIMLPVFTGKFDDDQLLFAFKKFDKNDDGTITVEEMRLILSKIGQHFTEKEIKDMIATVDADKNGKLSFDEFKRLMKTTN